MHAVMIIAHNQFELLEKLILALDDERNDIFVHIDAKVKNFDFSHFTALTKHSRVVFTDERINVTWGDFSQIKTEIVLLNTALACENPEKPYRYFHLISGSDLPIQSNDDIHRFFEENDGREFIHFTHSVATSGDVSRLRYYHLFRGKRTFIRKLLGQITLRLQILLHINRLKKMGIRVQKGSNWFSITGDFAHYIAENYQKYEKIFRYSYCGDETFVQTMLENSPYKSNLYMPECHNSHKACLRLIDWERGNPYVWRTEDFETIKNSSCIFARKFDLNVDSEIVEKVLDYIR